MALNLGYKRALFVHGLDGLDEISLLGATRVYELKDGAITQYEVTPEQFGLTRCKLSDIETGTPEANAQTIQDVFSGKDRGPRREAILINAAGALYIGGRADSIQEGIKKAAELIDSGAALHKLNQLVETSKKYAVKGA